MRPGPDRIIYFLDSASWLELRRHPLGFEVELHHPRRESGIGYIDKPRTARGPIAAALRRVLEERPLSDPAVVLADLHASGKLVPEAEPEL